jgi:hypothetical protein
MRVQQLSIYIPPCTAYLRSTREIVSVALGVVDGYLVAQMLSIAPCRVCINTYTEMRFTYEIFTAHNLQVSYELTQRVKKKCWCKIVSIVVQQSRQKPNIPG